MQGHAAGGHDDTIDLARIVLSMLVVFVHFWGFHEGEASSGPVGMAWLGGNLTITAVPVFVLISFQLTGRKLLSGDSSYFRKRLLRIMVPFLAWNIISSVFRLSVILLTGDHRYIASPGEYVFQFVAGIGLINPSLWFLPMIAFLILVTHACRYILQRPWQQVTFSGVFLLLHLLFLSFGVAGLDGYMRILVPTYLMMLCLLGVGLFLTPVRCAALRQHRKMILPVSVMAFFAFSYMHGCRPSYMVWATPYQGVNLIGRSLAVFLIFSCLPVEMLSGSVREKLQRIAGFAFGIYLCHYVVGSIVRAVILPVFGLEVGDLLQIGANMSYGKWLSPLVWATSLLVSFLLGRTRLGWLVR